MKLFLKSLSLIAVSVTVPAIAATLSCREEPNTRKHFCYLPSELRANADLRSFPLFTGGPKGADRTPYTAVVNCKVRYLEMRDRKGVVFARQLPKKQHIRALIDDVCTEAKVKRDNSLT